MTANFTSGATTIQTFNYPYYFRVANTAAINAKPAGIYDDLSILATVKLTSSGGAVQGSSLFGTTVSKPSYCWLSTPPSAMTINYTAFSASNQTGTSNFKASCTQNTTYTLSLDATSAVLLGLRYTLALSNTGTITGTGFEQSHSVTGTIAAGQAGTCTTGSCTGMQARTLTVTY